MRFAWVISLSVLLSQVACTSDPHACGNKALLPWPDAKGDYKLQEVSIETLSSLHRLDGPAAKVYYANPINENGFEGEPAEPHLTRSGDTCVPTDTASSLALGAYAQMERLRAFETRLGIAGQVPWPRKIGIDTALQGQPGDIHNNAHYIWPGDMLLIVPYSLNDLPMAFNHGPVAHENAHVHFQKQVMDRLNRSLAMASNLDSDFYPTARLRGVQDLSMSDRQTAAGLNNFILRGWNEGLAEFYHGVYTKRPDDIKFSVPEMTELRRLDTEPRAWSNAFNAQQSDLKAQAYQLGVEVGRTLYRVAMVGGLPPEAVLAHVYQRLPALADAIAGSYATSVMSVDAMLPPLLQGLALNASACATLQRVMTTETASRGVATCGR